MKHTIFPNGLLYEVEGVNLRFQPHFDHLQPQGRKYYFPPQGRKWILGVPFPSLGLEMNFRCIISIPWAGNFTKIYSYSVPLENTIDERRLDRKWIFQPLSLNHFQTSAFGLGLEMNETLGLENPFPISPPFINTIFLADAGFAS